MYIFPVQLPQISNREDLLLTVSIFDDDTGDAVDLRGITLAAPGDFTASAWTFTDGNIVTTSASTITLPDYPVGNQVISLSFTVGENLSIEAGDQFTLADTATGLNTAIGYVLSYVASTGAITVQIGVAFEFEIRSKGTRHGYDSGYTPFYDVGVYDDTGPILSAQLGNGITVLDTGVIQILIPASTFGKLHHKTYLAALTAWDGVPNTRQIFVGELPVQYGGVVRNPNQITTPASWANTF